MGIKEWLIVMGINAGLLLAVHFILSLRIIRSEGLSLWCIGRLFNDELLLLVTKKKNQDKATAQLINFGRALWIMLIPNTIVLYYLLKAGY